MRNDFYCLSIMITIVGTASLFYGIHEENLFYFFGGIFLIGLVFLKFSLLGKKERRKRREYAKEELEYMAKLTEILLEATRKVAEYVAEKKGITNPKEIDKISEEMWERICEDD